MAKKKNQSAVESTSPTPPAPVDIFEEAGGVPYPPKPEPPWTTRLSSRVCMDVIDGWVSNKTPACLDAAELLIAQWTAEYVPEVVTWLKKVVGHPTVELKDRVRAAKLLNQIGY